jgi:indolepyruvate ferredoxin oxidoreductase alpha subunit
LNPAEIFSNTPGKKVLMSGNEALTRGIFESGFKFTNALREIPYFGNHTGILIPYSGDSPILNLTNVQESMLYSLKSKIPILKPASVQECKDFIREGFRISELYRLPIYIHVNPLLYDSYGIVEFGELENPKNEKQLDVKPIHDVSTFFKSIDNHEKQNDSLSSIAQNLELFHLFNTIKIIRLEENLEQLEPHNIGIITSGIYYGYLIQACRKLKLSLPILKIGLIFPINRVEFLKFVNQNEIEILLIIEELGFLIEDFSKKVYNNLNNSRRNIEIHGKGYISNAGELDTSKVMTFLSQYFHTKNKYLFEEITQKQEALKEIIPTLPIRT